MKPAQIDQSGDALPVQQQTTAIYPNRVADKAKVDRLLGLPEAGDDSTAFRTPKGTMFAIGYVRVLYGDYGPYVEFRPDQVCCRLTRKFDQMAPAGFYYEWLVPADGSDVKVYDQKRDVKQLRNAPAGDATGNREEGFGDYVPGMIYVSPWKLTVQKRLAQPESLEHPADHVARGTPADGDLQTSQCNPAVQPTIKRGPRCA